MDIKLAKVLTYHERVPPLKSYGPCDCATNMRSHDNLKNLHLHFHKAYGHITCQSADFEGEV